MYIGHRNRLESPTKDFQHHSMPKLELSARAHELWVAISPFTAVYITEQLENLFLFQWCFHLVGSISINHDHYDMKPLPC